VGRAEREEARREGPPLLKSVTSRYNEAKEKKPTRFFADASRFEKCIADGFNENLSTADLRKRYENLLAVSAALEKEIKDAEPKR